MTTQRVDPLAAVRSAWPMTIVGKPPTAGKVASSSGLNWRGRDHTGESSSASSPAATKSADGAGWRSRISRSPATSSTANGAFPQSGQMRSPSERASRNASATRMRSTSASGGTSAARARDRPAVAMSATSSGHPGRFLMAPQNPLPSLRRNCHWPPAPMTAWMSSSG